MRLSHLFFLIIVLCCIRVSAKNSKDLVKATYYYNHGIYYKAIQHYEKIANQLNDPVIYAQLADCYTIINELQKASEVYLKAVNMPDYSKDILLKYAKVLMQLKQYDDAVIWLKKYLTKNANDVRASNMITGCIRAKSIIDSIPHGIARLLPFNTDGSDFAPTMWKDKLVFTTDTSISIKKKTDGLTGRNYYNIFSVPCNHQGRCGDKFSIVTEAKGVNIRYHDGPCTFSADGRQMYFTRSRYSNKFLGNRALSNSDSIVLLEIMIAGEFDTTEKKFKTLSPFLYNSENYTVAHPSVTPDGKILVFSSTMPKGIGGSDIYLCHKKNNVWSKPQNIGLVVNTEGDEVFPCWGDDSTLFFSSDGHPGLGGLDIFKCSWNKLNSTFSVPYNIGIPVNSSYDDISLAMYGDDRDTYFSSNRPAIKGGDNIYFYEKKRIFLKLIVIDSLSSQPITNASVVVDAGNGKKESSTDSVGQHFTQLHPDMLYRISVSKNGYMPSGLSISAISDKSNDTIARTIKLYVPSFVRKTDPIEPIKLKHKNVMDTPGIRYFEIDEVYELGRFHYDFDKYSLTDEHKIILDTLLIQMNRHITMRIEIRAHTDCRGSYEYNMALSANRALSVVNYLINHGIAKERLNYSGLGYTLPTIQCPDCASCTEAQHFQNRLLEFKVLKL